MPSSCDKHWVSSCRLGCETPQIVKGILPIHPFGRRMRKKRIEWSQRTRKDALKRGRRKEIERRRGGKWLVIHSNSSSILFPQLSLANTTSSGLLQKEGFCNQSFLSVRQLVVHTDSQLGWKEREGRERKEKVSPAFSLTPEGGERYLRPKPQWWFPVTLTDSSTSKQQPEELDSLNWWYNYKD